MRNRPLLSLLFAAVWLAGSSALAGETLRVGSSGDYAPFSVVEPDGGWSGFDPTLVRAFAEAHGYEIEWLPFSWPNLADELANGRFDLVASGVTVRADRALVGGFSVAVAETGAVVLARSDAGLSEEDLDRPGLAIAVNQGGHLEQVARLLFPAASLHAIPDNAAVLAALEAGEVDALVTDSAEAVHWAARPTAPLQFGPFTRDRKAWWIAPERRDLAREIDAWLIDRESDGTLARMRGVAGLSTLGRPARPLNALVAAIAERLALMPAVAEAKRMRGAAVQVPEREAIVLAAAVEGVRDAAARARLPKPSDGAIEAFFAELIAAARSVQEAVLLGPSADPETVPDLEEVLRPALGRIGDRIATLLPRLPGAVSEEALERELQASLDLPGFDAERRRSIVRAIATLAAAARE